MKSYWTLYSNAKSERNALVLLNKVKKYLPAEPEEIGVAGDRYCGHCIRFTLDHGALCRSEYIFQLLCHGEQLGNSWTLAAVAESARASCNRSRIAGIRQMEWSEVDPEGD